MDLSLSFSERVHMGDFIFLYQGAVVVPVGISMTNELEFSYDRSQSKAKPKHLTR